MSAESRQAREMPTSALVRMVARAKKSGDDIAMRDAAEAELDLRVPPPKYCGATYARGTWQYPGATVTDDEDQS